MVLHDPILTVLSQQQGSVPCRAHRLNLETDPTIKFSLQTFYGNLGFSGKPGPTGVSSTRKRQQMHVSPNFMHHPRRRNDLTVAQTRTDDDIF